MNGRTAVFALVVVALSFGFAVTPVTADSTTVHTPSVNECAAEPPEDGSAPDGETTDVIGWVDGYWYDDALDLELPLDEDELDSFVARTAARVEALRCLPFEEVPPVEFVTRDELEADTKDRVNSTEDAFWQFENARYATLLAAGQTVDARDVEIETQTGFPSAFYNTQTNRIGFVTEDPDSIEIDQVTLAHELLHALQDQYFDIGQIFEEPTTDDFISSLAVVEGEAMLLEELYEENCDGGWSDSCLTATPPHPGSLTTFVPTVNQLAAYHTPLVEQRYELGGWDAIDELFETMPHSTVEAIYPDQYNEFERLELEIPDESTSEWERISVEGESQTVLGQQKFTATFVAPIFEGHPGEIVPLDEFLEHADPMTGEEFYDYGVSTTDGWEGDAFVAYENDAEEVAGVLKTAWEDSDEAETFRSAYEQLVSVRGGDTEEFENVYTFAASNEYDMALGIQHDDERVWILTAPTVDDLTDVHGFEPQELDENGADNGDDTGVGNGADDGDDTGADDGDDTGVDDTDADGDDAADDVDDDGTGFGLLIAVIGLSGVTAVVLIARRTRLLARE